MARSLTTLSVTYKTRDDLEKIGLKKETFDDIIKRILDFYKKQNSTKEANNILN